MKSKNVRKISKVDETERIKLYKTHRGWCSSLSHFWTFLKADSIDEDDETSYEDYLKAIATIGTIAGATMLLPTTAMADSTQLQRTLDSRSSMALGLSSNTQHLVFHQILKASRLAARLTAQIVLIQLTVRLRKPVRANLRRLKTGQPQLRLKIQQLVRPIARTV